jgi:hypothetical protein
LDRVGADKATTIDLHALILIAFKFERQEEVSLRRWELTGSLTYRSGIEITESIAAMIHNLRVAEGKLLKMLDWRIPRSTIAGKFDEWLDVRHLTGSEEAGRACRILDLVSHDPRVYIIHPDVLFGDVLREARGLRSRSWISEIV